MFPESGINPGKMYVKTFVIQPDQKQHKVRSFADSHDQGER